MNPGPASALQALACLQSPGLAVFPTPASFPTSMWLSCFPKRLCLCPLPQPPTLCAHPQEHMKQRRGSAVALAELPPLPHHDWGPSTDLSPEPRMWPEPPQDRPLSAFLCLSPGFCSRVSGSPANFSITFFPPSLRTSPHFFQPSH